jgi:extradiol dioxygenase family protein
MGIAELSMADHVPTPDYPRFHLAFPVTHLAEARRFSGEFLGCAEGRSSDDWVDFDFFGHQIVAHKVDADATRSSSRRSPT